MPQRILRPGVMTPEVSAVYQMTKKFEMPPPSLRDVRKMLHEEILKGLKKATHPSADIKCLPTYVQVMPTEAHKQRSGLDMAKLESQLQKHETEWKLDSHLQPSKSAILADQSRENLMGFYLALDLGGTNIRVLSVNLRGRAEPHVNQSRFAIPKSKMEGPGNELFDYVAERVWSFMNDFRLFVHGTQSFQMGITFSFPLEQRGLTEAHLVNWTKGFKCAGVVGHDVVRMIQNSLEKKKRFANVSIQIVAILNDTTGCLMACARMFSCTRIGVIVGTGTNACYLEQVSEVETFTRTPETDQRPPRVIVNTEWGAFGNNGCLEPYRTPWDSTLDSASINKGKQIFEKMVSGMYLGEIVRLILLQATKEKILFKGVVTPLMNKKDIIDASFLSKCEQDGDDGYELTRAALEKSFGIMNASINECNAVKLICERVSVRASNLTAAALSVLLERVWAHFPAKVAIGADGSLFKHHPHFKSRVYAMMHLLLGGKGTFEYTIEEVSDASGVGAAITAACHNSGSVPTRRRSISHTPDTSPQPIDRSSRRSSK